MRLKLAVSLLVAVLSVPLAVLWGLYLPGAFLVGPLVSALAGFYAALLLSRSPQTVEVMRSLESYQPSEEFREAWQGAAVGEKRNWRGKPTGQPTERGGFAWIYFASKTVLSHLWSRQRKLTLIGGGLFLLFLLSAVSGVPGLSVLGAALGLYLFTTAAFTVINVMTDDRPSPSAG